MLKKALSLVLLSTLSFSETESLEQFQKQAAQAVEASLKAAGDLEASDLLMGKFISAADGKPVWYFQSYPNPGDMALGSSVRPRLVLVKPQTVQTVTLAPLLEIYRKKVGKSCSVGTSMILNPPALSFLGASALAGSDYCLVGAKSFLLDMSGLGSLEAQPASGNEQVAFISVLDRSKLSESQKTRIMGDVAFTTDTLLKELNGDSAKQAVMEPKRVVFKNYVAHPSHPQALGAIRTQVGSLLVDVPVPLPPQPKCQITRVGSGPIQPGDMVQFRLEVDSITRAGTTVFDRFSAEQAVPESAYRESNTVSLGTFKSIHTFSLKAAVNSQSRINGEGTRAWDVYAKVFGVRSDQGFYKVNVADDFSCQAEVAVQYAPPVCTLAAASTNILAGENTQVTLDCRAGGPLNSAQVNGVNVQIGGTNPNFLTTKLATVTVRRTESVNAQTISGEVVGRDGTVRPTVLLGKVCDFNNPNHQAVVIQKGQWASEAAARGKIQFVNEDPFSFSRNYLRVNTPYTTPVRAYLLPGQRLNAGQQLRAHGDLTKNWEHLRGNDLIGRCTPGIPCDIGNKCRFRADMQADGNFSLYNEGFWADDSLTTRRFMTGAAGSNSYLRMQEDGNLVLFNAQNKVVWTSGTSGAGNKLELRGNGWMGITNSEGVTVKVLNSSDWACNEIPQNRYNFSAAGGDWSGGWKTLSLQSGFDRAVSGFDMEYEACNGPGETNICMSSYFAEPIPASTGDYIKHGEFIYHGGQTYRMMAGAGFFWIAVDARDPSCPIRKLAARNGGCFAPNTRLQMANGQEKLVSEIMENDYVFNPHYQTGVRVRKVVKGPEKKSLYEVQLGKNSIQVTEDHPFLTQRGWVQALALKTGDQLMGEGPGKRVSRVEKLKYLGPQDVWNFELDTEDPLAHVVVANGIPTGDLVTQQELKKGKRVLP